MNCETASFHLITPPSPNREELSTHHSHSTLEKGNWTVWTNCFHTVNTVPGQQIFKKAKHSVATLCKTQIGHIYHRKTCKNI